VISIKYSFFLAIILLLIACSKTENGDKDVTLPVITIVSPQNNQLFNAGDPIQTTATASDNDKVTELHIHVINKSTGDLLRDIHSYPGKSTGSVEDFFPAQAGIIYTIQIIAKDPAQNTATAKVEVSVN
jgi:hypothetical protein